MTLHNLEELDDDLGRRSDQDLALAGLLGVVDGVERIVEDGSANHFGGLSEWRFSSRGSGSEVSAGKTTKFHVSLSRGREQGECPQRSVDEGSAAQCRRGEAYLEPL